MACPTVHMSARGYHVRLNCDAHLGVNTAQATRVHVSTCVGACAIEEEHKMRLQGGPPRRVALPRAPRLCACNPLEGRGGGRRCACNSLSPMPPQRRGTVALSNNSRSPLLYHPTFEAVATRGQSQHSGQSQPWLLFSQGLFDAIDAAAASVGRSLRS